MADAVARRFRSQLLLFVSGVLYVVMLHLNLTLEVPASFAVYDHLFSAARFLLSAKRPDGFTADSPCGPDKRIRSWNASAPPLPRWARADDARGLQSLMRSFERLERLAMMCAVYQVFAAAGLLLFVAGIVQRMGVVNVRMRFVEVRHALRCTLWLTYGHADGVRDRASTSPDMRSLVTVERERRVVSAGMRQLSKRSRLLS